MNKIYSILLSFINSLKHILKNLAKQIKPHCEIIYKPKQILFFIILLLINSILFTIYFSFYIIFSLYWFFKLLIYVLNFINEIKPGWYIKIKKKYKMRGYLLFFLGQTVFKAYFLSFSSLYNILKNLIEEKNDKKIFLLSNVIVNIFIRFITGFTKNIILDSLKWSSKIMMYEKTTSFESFILLNINTDIYSNYIYISINRIYKTINKKFNFNPMKKVYDLNNVIEIYKKPKVKIIVEKITDKLNIDDSYINFSYKSTNKLIIDFISKISHQHAGIWADKRKEHYLSINETTKKYKEIPTDKDNTETIQNETKIDYKNYPKILKHNCYFTDLNFYDKKDIKILNETEMTLEKLENFTLKEPILKAKLYSTTLKYIWDDKELIHIKNNKQYKFTFTSNYVDWSIEIENLKNETKNWKNQIEMGDWLYLKNFLTLNILEKHHNNAFYLIQNYNNKEFNDSFYQNIFNEIN